MGILCEQQVITVKYRRHANVVPPLVLAQAEHDARHPHIFADALVLRGEKKEPLVVLAHEVVEQIAGRQKLPLTVEAPEERRIPMLLVGGLVVHPLFESKMCQCQFTVPYNV